MECMKLSEEEKIKSKYMKKLQKARRLFWFNFDIIRFLTSFLF